MYLLDVSKKPTASTLILVAFKNCTHSNLESGTVNKHLMLTLHLHCWLLRSQSVPGTVPRASHWHIGEGPTPTDRQTPPAY